MGICRVVTSKVTFVRAPQTHVIRRCAVDDLRPASCIRVVPCSSRAIAVRHSGCSNVP